MRIWLLCVWGILLIIKFHRLLISSVKMILIKCTAPRCDCLRMPTGGNWTTKVKHRQRFCGWSSNWSFAGRSFFWSLQQRDFSKTRDSYLAPRWKQILIKSLRCAGSRLYRLQCANQSLRISRWALPWTCLAFVLLSWSVMQDIWCL